jgi:hypothetical protein
MGRPFYSQTYISEPAVRTESPPTIPPYEKWTYWNAFDPDSEEFFENDPVCEAFIDHHPANEDGRLMVHILEESESSASSEGSVSEQGSPMAVGSDDPARMLGATYQEYWALQRQPSASSPVDVPSMRTDNPSQYPSSFSVTPEFESRVLGSGNRQRSATVVVLPQRRLSTPLQNSIDNLPRTSNITPITIPSRPSISNTPAPLPYDLPSTPPSQTVLPNQMTTPRILTWASRAPTTAGSPSLPGGPLTNPSARMALAHITPSLIRVRDVII